MNYRFHKARLLLGAAILLPIDAPLLAQTTNASPTTADPSTPPASATGGTSTPTSTSATTTEPPIDEYAGDEEAIVIKGSKPPGSVIGDIPPENTLDTRDVRATGATTITELLDAIAPQIGSSRGRGGESPVLLLNGQRVSGFREVRDIPTEAILRVEILPEEVALKYGYRADQKVVNIVLRQRFRSTTAQIGANTSTDGGYVGGNADVTRFLVQKNGRTQFNVHAEGNGMLTEAERDIRLTQAPPTASDEQELAARSLIGTKRQLRGAATFNRNILGNVSATLNAEVEHDEGHSLNGLGENVAGSLGRDTTTNSAHVGTTLNGTKAQWKWNVTGNADWARDTTGTDRDIVTFPRDRARETRTSADLTGTANGTLFKVPAGNASATFRVGGSTEHLDGESTRQGVQTPASFGRTTGTASVNFDLPVSRRNRAFSALGNLTVNANAEVDQLSDFGTLTTIGAGANWSPVDRLSFITSWTREEGSPSIQQLGDPQLVTPDTRIFDFTTGQTALVTATTGGNPNLQSDKRNVLKVGGNWQPIKDTDLRLRAEYVHQTIDRPISGISVTPQIEQAFPNRFQRGACTPAPCIGPLLSVDLTPVNFDSSRRDTLRFGFDFSKPLKSRRPSQAVIDQIRAQFRGGGGRSGAAGNTPAGQATPPPNGTPPPDAGPPPGGPSADGGRGPGGGGGFGGFGGGGRGGGGFGGSGGGNRGRLTFSLTDTVTFVDKTVIAPGLELDYLHGDVAGQSGGTPRHNVEAQAGYFNNGLGARIGAKWRSGTEVNTLSGDDLHFGSLATFDLRLFANPGDIPEVALKHPWLRGAQVRFEVTNVFNTRPSVRNSSGALPLNYQSDLLDPLGRVIGISIRKLFLPPPSFFRQQRERERQQATTTG